MYNVIKTPELITRIKSQCKSSVGGRPPFTLVVGSGFSYPLIPTTAEIVRKDLPWWDWCQQNTTSDPKPDFHQEPSEDARKYTVEFWKRVRASDMDNTFQLSVDGLPTDDTITQAYKLMLSPSCHAALGTPDRVRRYFMDVVARVGNRLNPAHLYAASLIAAKPDVFGTVFTTNFDPLLQRALQLVNAPYFVSDRPDTMQHPDDDHARQAVHLVHVHGSIYRYLLLNTPQEIESYANRNKALLVDYFSKHGVLVVGYSGWDDAVTRALGAVESFGHNLYWCGRGPSPDESGLSEAARMILAKHINAFYVPIASADDLMVNLHQELTGHALPHLFRDPLGTVQSELDRCDLRGVKIPTRETARQREDGAAADAHNRDAASSTGESDSLDLGDEVQSIRNRLRDAQRIFKGESIDGEHDDQQAKLAAHVRQRLTEATDLYFAKKYNEALPHLNFVVEHSHVLDPVERSLARFRRGVAYSRRGLEGDFERAITDFTTVIDTPDATAEARGNALIDRGIAYGVHDHEGDIERAIADFTAVIDMPDAPAKQRANAHMIRAFAFGMRDHEGDVERAIADFTAIINMPDAPAEQRANALENRNRRVTDGRSAAWNTRDR